MAKAFHGAFTALFVETSDFASQSEQDRKRLRDHVHLAEELGARIATAYGDDPAVQIAEYARISGISKVVLGRSPRKRGFTSPKTWWTGSTPWPPIWTSTSSRTRRPGRASGCGGCGSPRKSSPPRTWPRCWEFCCCTLGGALFSHWGLPTPMSSCSIFWGFGHRHGYHRPELQCGGLGAVGADL